MKLTVFSGKNACFGSMIMLLVLQSLLRRNFLLFCIFLIPEPLMIINIIFRGYVTIPMVIDGFHGDVIKL